MQFISQSFKNFTILAEMCNTKISITDVGILRRNKII